MTALFYRIFIKFHFDVAKKFKLTEQALIKHGNSWQEVMGLYYRQEQKFNSSPSALYGILLNEIRHETTS